MTQTPIRAQRFTRFNERKCRGKLSLDSNVLKINGWCLRGRVSKTVRLTDLDKVTAVPSRSGNNLFLHFSDGTVTGIRINKGAVYFAHVLNDCLGDIQPDKKILPGKIEFRQAV